MSFFLRIWRWFKSEANSAIDLMEDEVKLTQQGIRDLKKQLNDGQMALASVRAQTIQAKRRYEDVASKPQEYEDKAVLLLKKGKEGSLPTEKADRLAMVALAKKESYEKESSEYKKAWVTLKTNCDNFEVGVNKLKNEVEKWEEKVKLLASRKQLADARTTINKQLNSLDPSSTLAMLDKMKDRTDEAEALAQAHEEIASTASIDDEIDQALALPSNHKTTDSLLELKKRLGA